MTGNDSLLKKKNSKKKNKLQHLKEQQLLITRRIKNRKSIRTAVEVRSQQTQQEDRHDWSLEPPPTTTPSLHTIIQPTSTSQGPYDRQKEEEEIEFCEHYREKSTYDHTISGIYEKKVSQPKANQRVQ